MTESKRYITTCRVDTGTNTINTSKHARILGVAMIDGDLKLVVQESGSQLPERRIIHCFQELETFPDALVLYRYLGSGHPAYMNSNLHVFDGGVDD